MTGERRGGECVQGHHQQKCQTKRHGGCVQVDRKSLPIGCGVAELGPLLLSLFLTCLLLAGLLLLLRSNLKTWSAVQQPTTSEIATLLLQAQCHRYTNRGSDVLLLSGATPDSPAKAYLSRSNEPLFGPRSSDHQHPAVGHMDPREPTCHSVRFPARHTVLVQIHIFTIPLTGRQAPSLQII